MSTFNCTPIYASGRIVGEVEGNVFSKTIRGKHYLRKPPAIAFDIQSLVDAEEAGAEYVHVLDLDSGRNYYTTLNRIWIKGKKFNRGYGDQIFLCLEYWSNNENNNRQPVLFG